MSLESKSLLFASLLTLESHKKFSLIVNVLYADSTRIRILRLLRYLFNFKIKPYISNLAKNGTRFNCLKRDTRPNLVAPTYVRISMNGFGG